MFDKDAIKELTKAEAITAAATTMTEEAPAHMAALPNDFTVHDFERHALLRRRARGTMTTASISDFAVYANRHADDGATVFIRQDMTAVAVLNLGTPNAPGHADNKAKLVLQQTAAYKALLAMAGGGGHSQTTVAEWLEDWNLHIECFHEGEQIPVRHAAAAVRKITIEALRRVESEEQQLGTSRSAMESVQAKETGNLPTTIHFSCEPHLGLKHRTFSMRLGIITGDKPKLTLRIAAFEVHAEEMAEEMAVLVRNEVGDGMPCLVGDYAAAA